MYSALSGIWNLLHIQWHWFAIAGPTVWKTLLEPVRNPNVVKCVFIHLRITVMFEWYLHSEYVLLVTSVGFHFCIFNQTDWWLRSPRVKLGIHNLYCSAVAGSCLVACLYIIATESAMQSSCREFLSVTVSCCQLQWLHSRRLIVFWNIRCNSRNDFYGPVT